MITLLKKAIFKEQTPDWFTIAALAYWITSAMFFTTLPSLINVTYEKLGISPDVLPWWIATALNVGGILILCLSAFIAVATVQSKFSPWRGE